jgi:hypothetical protein
MSPMYPTLERLYDAGRLTVAQLDNAVVKGWITEQEKLDILA